MEGLIYNLILLFSVALFSIVLFLYTYLLYLYLKKARPYEYLRIESFTHLGQYFVFLSFLMTLISLLFTSRYKRMNLELNLDKLFFYYKDLFFQQNFSMQLAILILGFAILLFWVIFLGLFYRRIKDIILSIHVFLVLNKLYFNFCHRYFHLHLDICRIPYKIFGDFGHIVDNFIRNILKFIWRFGMLYLIIFDYFINDGVLSKIFIIAPWFFLFTLTNKFLVFFHDSCMDINLYELSEKYYPREKTYPHWE